MKRFVLQLVIPSLFAAVCFGSNLATAEPPLSPAQSPAQSPALPAVENIDAASRAKWLMEGPVVDSESGLPIAAFTVIPGSISTDDDGKATIRWRDNLKREMKDGLLQWPRTSGFSVMRFRIVAEGYQPAVSPIIRRGGPHLRLKMKLAKVAETEASDQSAVSSPDSSASN
ncbi:hypothetical protein [Rhodopirellula sp. MGV]|uniref:hypothetical protein n=1 Tax=Rhodopirellula sp. MGV TaxID=2023130 RepID=UPI000B9675C4|nr:hypothetical protein [Rhodopirellula sp. MGV]OYP28383.1 hypothetical protein CGZ80_26585 [Rhodopirellula sp. MGV]PNY38741.1 hypothetical protein C2E31_02205 [Rhodopirellula baltica]